MTATNMNFAILILAAGEGSRFGSPKQLALFDGIPLLEHAIRLANALGKQPFVALGAHREAILGNQSLASKLRQHAQVVGVDNWDKGMSQSIREGTAIVRESGAEGILILLADQPLITSNDLNALLNEVDGSKQIIAAQYKDGAGVPAYFSKDYFQDLLSLEGDVGARRVINSHPHVLINLHDHLVDLDYERDLSKLMANRELS